MMFKSVFHDYVLTVYYQETGEFFVIVEPKHVLRFYSFRIVDWKPPMLFDILLNESCNGKTRLE